MSKLLLSSLFSKSSRFRSSLAGFPSRLALGAALLGVSAFGAHAAQSVALAWDANADPSVVGYRYHQGSSSGNYSQSVDVGSAKSVSINSLSAGQTYFFAVTSYNASGQESLASNQVSFTASTAPTPTPTPIPTPTPTPTPSPSPSPSPKPTPTPSPTPTPTPTPSPSPNPSPSPVNSPTPAPASTISFFSATDTPASLNESVSSPVELGVRFQSSSSGTVSAIRFFKGPQNSGTHIGHLWSSSGALLASATFTNETPSGWQQVNLPLPVSLTAGSTYTVSYHTTGSFSLSRPFFNKPLLKGPLTAPASSASSGNGVFAYGQASVFPDQSYQASNYWVDLAFLPSSALPSAPAASAPPSLDAKAFADQGSPSSTVVSSAFSTSSPNELLLAFIATDYVSGANTSVTTVTGAGLNWVLAVRTNVQGGSSEIWRAFASAPLSHVNVTATLSQAVASSLTVTSFKGVDLSGSNGSGALGAISSANAASGVPSASLLTTRNNSLVVGVGNDYDAAIARVLPSGQSLLHQFLSPAQDTYWVQIQNSPTLSSGTNVSINDLSPNSDRFNLSLCEILPAK
jgi:outer membrane biosynthesis protein TonB